jgi:uncharacterized membrane protein
VDGDLNALAAAAMVVVAIIALVATIRVTQIVVHALQRGRSARAILERRLAKGEIDTDQFLELESALRTSEPKAPPRPRRLLRL